MANSVLNAPRILVMLVVIIIIRYEHMYTVNCPSSPSSSNVASRYRTHAPPCRGPHRPLRTETRPSIRTRSSKRIIIMTICTRKITPCPPYLGRRGIKISLVQVVYVHIYALVTGNISITLCINSPAHHYLVKFPLP
ncbi:hypothetical protein HDV62DRAFT_349500 [Trichoderma sp. SZMC 28011]